MTSFGHDDDQPRDDVTEIDDEVFGKEEPVDAEIVDDEVIDAETVESETVGANEGPNSPVIEIDAEDLGDNEMTLEDILASDDVIKERDEYLDALRRVQAEFDNFRKRTTRQQGEASERAKESLLERLLPVLDALDLALAHVATDPEDTSSETAALTQIASLLRDTLYKEGLERIDEIEVDFDPTVHDAVAHLPDEPDSEAKGVVIAQVLRAGYRLKGRVVRPAMVQVRG